jgi:hypothetical protein
MIKDWQLENSWADEHNDPGTKQQILEKYQHRWKEPVPTPLSHPWMFDPLHPPKSWRYDPYYELWIKNEN